MLSLLLLACSGSEPAADTVPDTVTGAVPDCLPLRALFFDLGNTLVAEGDDGLYAAMPGVETMLDALESRGTPLGVITNVPDDWSRTELEALLADPAILDRFEVVLLSSQATAPKPDPVIFTEALGLISSQPDAGQAAFVTEELSHIADADPATEGARAVGMMGIHLSDEASDLASHTLAPDALSSLPEASWMDCVD